MVRHPVLQHALGSEDGVEHPFYEWMTIGFQAFRVIEDAFPRYRSGAVEGFGDRGVPARNGGGAVGVPPAEGHEPPRVAADGAARAVGRRGGAPADRPRGARGAHGAVRARTPVQRPPGIRGRARSSRPPPRSPPARTVVPPHLLARASSRRPQGSRRGLRRSGRTALTGREFAPGHDAKRKSALWARARQGQDAVDELEAAGVGHPSGDAMSGVGLWSEDAMRFETRAIHVGQDPGHRVRLGQRADLPDLDVRAARGRQAEGLGLRARRQLTREALAAGVALPEGGSRALCFSSGLGATTTLLLTLKPGDHVLISDDVYGGIPTVSSPASWTSGASPSTPWT